MLNLLKYKKILIFLPVLFVLIGGGILYKVGDNKGYAPSQPFNFSHKIHAGEMKIDCQYCHFGAARGRAALVPPLQVCMNCHTAVAGDKPAIQKLKEMFKKGEEVQWTRVHDLPDFVYFSHWQHIAKGLECRQCHGDIETMSRVRQAKNLKMGWCLDCHRGLDEDGKPRNGPTECSYCHQ